LRKMGKGIIGPACVAAALLCVLLAGCGVFRAGFTQISAQEAQRMMEAGGNYLIVDVRTPEEYAVAHVKGAICVPNESIGEEDIPQLPDKGQTLFLYCRSGNRSKQAAKKLAKLGYTQVYEFGGLSDWRGEITIGAE